MNENTINFLNNIDFENTDNVYHIVETLYEENKKYKEVIDKAIMYVNSTRYSDTNGLQKYSIKEFWFIKELEDILKEVE